MKPEPDSRENQCPDIYVMPGSTPIAGEYRCELGIGHGGRLHSGGGGHWPNREWVEPAELERQPRTDSGADDPLGELRWELGARTRQYDRVCRDMRALTEEVISALSTAQHRMTLCGALPFCVCGLSLAGGDASGTFITHILAIWREGR